MIHAGYEIEIRKAGKDAKKLETHLRSAEMAQAGEQGVDQALDRCLKGNSQRNVNAKYLGLVKSRRPYRSAHFTSRLRDVCERKGDDDRAEPRTLMMKRMDGKDRAPFRGTRLARVAKTGAWA